MIHPADEFSGARGALLDLLWDRKWHSRDALLAVAGHRYGARLGELRRDGWRIESHLHPHGKGTLYRLRSHKKGPRAVKRVQVLFFERDAEVLLETGTLTRSAARSLRRAFASFRRHKEKL